MLKVLFHSIGILVHYNWGLPYYIVRRYNAKPAVLSNLLQMFMGGYFYYNRSGKAIRFRVVSSGLSLAQKAEKRIDKLLRSAVTKFVEVFTPDLLHINSADSDLLEVSGIPKIFVIHGGLDFVKNERSFCAEMWRIYSKVNAIVAPSRHAAKNLKGLCGIDSRVIHHGVDVELFDPFTISKHNARRRLKIDPDALVILWNARMDPLKGLHSLIRALPRTNAVKDFRVVLLIKTRTLNTEYYQYILSLIHKAGLDKNVIIDKSWTPINHMPLVYRATDLYINSSYTEAFGSLTMLEAMACGIPVVARNASSNPEALGDAGLLYNNEDELAESIDRLVYDHKLRKYYTYKALGRIIRENLTLLDVARKYVDLYKAIL